MYLKKSLKTVFACMLTACLLMSVIVWAPSAAQAEALTANPNATPEAKALLSYLYNISGKNIISGQFNYIEDINYWTTEAARITGKQPGLWGGDFSFYFGVDLNEARQNLVDTAIEQWENGSIISICFHQQKPSDPWDAGWWSVQGWYTEEEMTELVTPGTELYNQWLADIDEIAGYLKQLQDAGVPVLWRPYHEMNGGWFWWGGRAEQFKQLWKNMFDRYTNYHGLNNLIWVWSAATNNEWADPLADFYPGHEYVDMLGLDVYYNDYQDAYYNELLSVAEGKPVAITECGELPDMDMIQTRQPLYTYFMSWGKMLLENNSESFIKEVYEHPYTLTQDEIELSMPVNLVKNPEFDNGADNWKLQQTSGAQGRMNVVTGSELSGVNSLRIELTEVVEGAENAQVYQTLPIESGKDYTISFMAKADAPKEIEVQLANSKSDNSVYWSQSVTVSTSPETYGPFTFSSDVTDMSSVLKFNVGDDDTALYIDSIIVNDGTEAGLRTPPPSKEAETWVTVDDRDLSIKYEDTWIRESLSRDYNGGETYTNIADNYAQFTFEGTAVQYIGSKQQDMGIVDIYIDDEKDTSIDLYKPGNGLPCSVLYEKTGLEPGLHTIKLVVTGTKNDLASDCYVVLDAFKYYYVPTPEPEPEPEPDPVNLIVNSGFDNGMEGWYWMQSGTADGSMSVVTDEAGNNELKATMLNAGSDPWNAQVNQDFPIESGKTYTISFKARADAPRKISVIIQQNVSPYIAYWFKDIDLTENTETFGSYTFYCNTTDPGAVLRFNLGGDATSVYIDDVVITAQ